jgi:hypothetical protein
VPHQADWRPSGPQSLFIQGVIWQSREMLAAP